MKQLQNSINHTSFLIADILESSLYVKDFFEFLDYDIDNHKVQSNLLANAIDDPRIFSTDITFKNLYYKYPMSDRFALKDVSLNIKKKEKVAIVGDNGSGKVR
ncbi:ATP-binding cassette domain-containing protein [Sporolactobacillus sp. THM7-4]|nr:ATP-binding cassette domain-containing protein [Sporolactobacillus sp. THM7-4]